MHPLRFLCCHLGVKNKAVYMPWTVDYRYYFLCIVWNVDNMLVFSLYYFINLSPFTHLLSLLALSNPQIQNWSPSLWSSFALQKLSRTLNLTDSLLS